MSCTTLMVGKNASWDGSTLLARSSDCSLDHWSPKVLTVIHPDSIPHVYRPPQGKPVIPLPPNPMRYTAAPETDPARGPMQDSGINIENVAMSATETINTSPAVYAADPLIPDSLGERDFVSVVLPFIHSARDGVRRLGSLLEKYGTSENSGVAFQDVNEIWYLETLGGHHWFAKRVPDDSYVIAPNMSTITDFDMADALGKQSFHMCSADLPEFIIRSHTLENMSTTELKKCRSLDTHAILGTRRMLDGIYNTPRIWFVQRMLSRRKFRWDGPEADFTPQSFDFRWALQPDCPIDMEDVKRVFAAHYEFTDSDPYALAGDAHPHYRPIGISRSDVTSVTQIRPYCPEEIRALHWIAFGCNMYNSFTPFYANCSEMPPVFSKADGTVSTDCFYWISRLISAMADAHYADTCNIIWDYQSGSLKKYLAIIAKRDAEWTSKKPKNSMSFLTKCNAEISETAHNMTLDLLKRVLDISTHNMICNFDISDVYI